MWSCRFLPTPGRSCTTGMPSADELGRRADAREQQQPRRVDGAAGDDDLRVGAGLSLGLSLTVYSTPTARPFSTRTLRAQGVGHDRAGCGRLRAGRR